VLAAAVAGRADVLVTENLKDFPPAAVAHLGIAVVGQDDFLSGLLELYPDARTVSPSMVVWSRGPINTDIRDEGGASPPQTRSALMSAPTG
jgi:hypothetical protein